MYFSKSCLQHLSNKLFGIVFIYGKTLVDYKVKLKYQVVGV